MFVKSLLSFVLIFAIGSPAAVATDDEFLIVPGKRVGWIDKTITEYDLRYRYGDDRIKPILVHVGEGEYCRASRVLFKDGAHLDVIWSNYATGAAAASVEVYGPDWHTVEGVNINTGLLELEKINGRPFLLAGHDWDNSGIVTSWEGGKLEKYKDSIVLLLGASKESYEKMPREEYLKVSGSGNFPSTHLVMRKLNMKPYRLEVYLVEDGQCEAANEIDLEKRK